ncbi:MAG: ComEC/Rec2 family competence protein [Patescibacteria group bacterium]
MKLGFDLHLNYTPFFLSVSLLILLNIFVYSVIFIEETGPELKLTFFDVGQGDCALIESRSGNRMLIDVGGGVDTAHSVAESLPFYDQSLDIVLITHPHADHMDGFVPLLEAVDVTYVLDSGSGYKTGLVDEYEEALDQNDIRRIYTRRGMIIDLGDGVFVHTLFPERDTRLMDPDDSSVWVKIDHKESSFLFTGDSSSSVEEYLVDLDGEVLESDIFQAGHHGSKTSNSLDLLEVVLPRYVVVSAGEDNSYGHPNDEVLETFDYVGADVLETSKEGDIVFISGENGLLRVE